MTLKSLIDTFKESIENANLLTELTPEYTVICLTVALLCGVLIYLVYRLFYRGACYSESFNLLNVMTTLVTSLIILTISSNIVLSLGMVGALSIVRFRAAVKDPLDVGFLFWAVAAGLTCGAGLYIFALAGTLFIAAVYIVFTLVGGGRNRYLLVISFDDPVSGRIKELLAGRHGLRLKSSLRDGALTELTYSIRIRKNDTLLDTLVAEPGVKRAMLIEYTGENQ